MVWNRLWFVLQYADRLKIAVTRLCDLIVWPKNNFSPFSLCFELPIFVYTNSHWSLMDNCGSYHFVFTTKKRSVQLVFHSIQDFIICLQWFFFLQFIGEMIIYLFSFSFKFKVFTKRSNSNRKLYYIISAFGRNIQREKKREQKKKMKKE